MTPEKLAEIKEGADKVCDYLLANYPYSGPYERALIDTVVRPYYYAVMQAQVDQVEPAQVIAQATATIIGGVLADLTNRMADVNNDEMLMTIGGSILQHVIDRYNEALGQIRGRAAPSLGDEPSDPTAH